MMLMDKYLITGSLAMSHWFSDYYREPKDADLLVYGEVNTNLIDFGELSVERFIVGGVENLDYCVFHDLLLANGGELYLNPELLLTLKLSHLNHDLKNDSWMKHYRDCVWLMNKGIKVDLGLFERLYAFWLSYHNDKSYISLNKSANEFFMSPHNQNHDELHEVFKLGEVPAFSLFLKDGAEVMVDKNKFFALSQENQLCSVVEETFVIAYERNLTISMGLRHLTTRLSKGFWNKFILLNLNEVDKMLNKYRAFFYDCKNKLNL